MVWRILHDSLKWAGISFFPTIGFIFIAGTALASSFPETKPWLAQRYADAFAVMGHPVVWAIALLIVVVWLVAIIWSGHKVGKLGNGDTHIHHHYQTLPEKLGQIPAAQPVHIQPDSTTHEQITGELNVTEGSDALNASGVTGLHGIYIGYIIAAAGALENERRLDFAIVGYNGSTDTLRVADVAGRIRAGIGNLRDYVELPTPLFQGVLNAEPGKEFVLQMRQDVSLEQAEEYLSVLAQKKHVGLDLRQLNIVVSSVVSPEKNIRLPLWDGVNLRSGDDVVSTRNTIMSVGMAAETDTALALQISASIPLAYVERTVYTLVHGTETPHHHAVFSPVS